MPWSGLQGKKGSKFVIHYLDVLGAPDSDECAGALNKLEELFERLGLPVAVEKREGLATVLKFLGFEMDSLALTIRLPTRKLEELKRLLQQWQGRKVATR